MPSLQQLEEFKSSFNDVGSEALVMKNNQLPMEELDLPDNEALAPFPEELAGGPDLGSVSGSPDLDALDLPPEDFAGGSDFSFGDLLGGDTLGAGAVEDASPLEDLAPLEEIPEAEDAGDFGAMEDLPADLLSGFAEDIESGGLPADEAIPAMPEAPAAPPSSAAPGTTPSGPPDPSLDLPEFPDIDLTHAVDMGGESRDLAQAGKSEPPPDLNIPEGSSEDFSQGADSFGGDLGGDFGDLGDLGEGSPLDLGGDFGASEPEPAGAADAGDFGMDIPDFGSTADLGGDFSLPEIPEALEEPEEIPEEIPEEVPDFGSKNIDVPDFGDSSEPADSFDAGDLGSMDLGGDAPTETPAAGADSFDNFDLGGEEWKPPAEALDTPDFSAPPTEDFGDFSLAGFDDTFTPGAPGTARTGPVPSASDDVEEIRLSESDYKKLQNTLSDYPLNLRVACEELIAEQAVAPELMSALIKLLVRGAPARETASMAGKILGRTIPIPRGYIKQTGAELEAERSSFGYIFVHRFLPVLRLFGAIALVAASLFYLGYRFVYLPLKADGYYKEGYTMLQSGEYTQANERFLRGFETYRVKKWFYRYAEGFRAERQYIFAEQKYDELLRVYPRDKKGALDYASMETYRENYEKADLIIRTNILDYAVNDKEGLAALAENNLAWGETDPSRYEDARSAYARLIEKYGRQDPYLEGMLKYFIRTDKLNEVLSLRSYFMTNPKKRKITVPTLAELGGYLLDKKFTEVEGVPAEYIDEIEGIRDVLLRAINADGNYPESYYHLARYYNRYGSTAEERASLRDAIRAFDNAPEETARRVGYRVDAHRRYAEVLINAGEFFPAEEELVRGVRIYEDALARQVLKTQSEFGRLYADLGDLEFFAKDGDMTAALRFYQEGERNGWAPPEIQYRMGAAHYQNEEWEEALQRFFALTPSMPTNKRLLYALGNVSYMRGNYFAAQAYYNRLMDLLDAERVRFPNLMPGSRPEELDLTERIMVADNNLGVTLEALTQVSGDTKYRSRALGLFSEAIRAWDVLTRNPDSMTRMRPIKDLYSPGVNLPYLNAQNILRPEPSYDQQLFMRIDKDALEPSLWETLVPRDYQLSDQLEEPYEYP